MRRILRLLVFLPNLYRAGRWAARRYLEQEQEKKMHDPGAAAQAKPGYATPGWFDPG